ncbi:MAG: tetratricopeptide repeat protein [Methanobacterium sp.]
MGWIHCPNCKNKISAKSTRCYYCGYQIKGNSYQKERKTSNNVRFCLYVMGGVAAIIAFIPMLLQSHFRYIWLFVLFIIFLVGYIFAYLFSYKFEDKKQKEALKKWIIKKPSRSAMLPEEICYYKGKTNQQLHQYSEALEYYNKSLELNPNFEPANKAKKEVEKVIK